MRTGVCPARPEESDHLDLAAVHRTPERGVGGHVPGLQVRAAVQQRRGDRDGAPPGGRV